MKIFSPIASSSDLLIFLKTSLFSEVLDISAGFDVFFEFEEDKFADKLFNEQKIRKVANNNFDFFMLSTSYGFISNFTTVKIENSVYKRKNLILLKLCEVFYKYIDKMKIIAGIL